MSRSVVTILFYYNFCVYFLDNSNMLFKDLSRFRIRDFYTRMSSNETKHCLIKQPHKLDKRKNNAKARRDWESDGNVWPKCINLGCNNDCVVRDWKKSGIPSIKTECGKCQKARISGITLPDITFHKKTYCENIDGRLGFVCPVNLDVQGWSGTFPPYLLEMDHIDGGGVVNNNARENVNTFCKLCHGRKGYHNKDFDSSRKNNRDELSFLDHMIINDIAYVDF